MRKIIKETSIVWQNKVTSENEGTDDAKYANEAIDVAYQRLCGQLRQKNINMDELTPANSMFSHSTAVINYNDDQGKPTRKWIATIVLWIF